MKMNFPAIIPPYSPKELLTIPSQAAEIHSVIVNLLQQLESAECKCCLDQEFKIRYFRILEFFEQYQNTVVNSSRYSISCKRGCAQCCFHWVEDVNSFEAEIIAEYISLYLPDRLEVIIEQCERDVAALDNVEKLTIDKLSKAGLSAHIDYIDLVLSVFYQMKRPCPLISEKWYLQYLQSSSTYMPHLYEFF